MASYAERHATCTTCPRMPAAGQCRRYAGMHTCVPVGMHTDSSMRYEW